jgi:hypothetical protein
MRINIIAPTTESHRLWTVIRMISFAFLGLTSLVFASNCSTASNEHRQSMIHTRGADIMPFDLSKTQHIFEMTEGGGIQDVIVRNTGDQEQIAMIQMHLQHEAMQFRAGDFSDPASLHGGNMPGVRELSKDVSQIKIEYRPLADGGRIQFTTSNAHLITAIHRWFGAQLSDHGADATYR